MALHVLSYNILYGGEERLSHIAHIIDQQQPDVVALLEANSLPNAEALARQLGMQLTFGEANNTFHVAWLSRLPLVRTENYRLPVLSKTLLKIEVAWQDTSLALFATHLRAGRDLESDRYRVAEMQAILTIMRQHSDRPHLLAGDFNSLHPQDQPDTALYLSTAAEGEEKQMRADQFPRQVISLPLEAGYIDSYRVLHPASPGYTYASPTPSLRLDYIFASSLLAPHLHACDIITSSEAEIASDHLPIWAEFR
jgi:exodeoxyribonuclease-3